MEAPYSPDEHFQRRSGLSDLPFGGADVLQLDTNSAGTTVFDHVSVHDHVKAKQASFNSLPPELRNTIYELVLRRSGRIRIWWKYGLHVPDYLQLLHRWLPALQKGASVPLLAREIESASPMVARDICPPLALALPLFRREILSMHYSENAFRIKLCNGVERHLFRDWVLRRGGLLKGLKNLKLAIPAARFDRGAVTVWLSLGDEGQVIVSWRSHFGPYTPLCACDVAVAVSRRLSSRPHAAFDCTMALDVGPVASFALAYTEAMELAEEAWVARNLAHLTSGSGNPNCAGRDGRGHHVAHCRGCVKPMCEGCGMEVAYLV